MTPRAYDLVVDRRGVARFMGRRAPCAIGWGGISADKREGDGATPVGRFRFEFGYWRPDRLRRPASVPPFRPIRPTDGWSDDPADPLYNQPVRRSSPFRHEAMRRADPLYDVVVVLDANREPIRPGRGSALFVHVWRSPRRATEGCVAFSRADLLWILARWRPWSRLVVLG